MADTKTAKEPFRFYTRLHISELTGLRAYNLEQLVELMKKVPGACIYHHTHRFLQQHLFLSPEPPNDFAYWISSVLGDTALGEQLVSIDTIAFSSIHDLRSKMIEIIENYLITESEAKKRFAGRDSAFHFIKSISFVIPTQFTATDLRSFTEILKKVSIDSIYFHIFEARLRLEKENNDFSNWIGNSLGDKKLAKRISGMDPYTYTLEELRQTIVSWIEKKLGE